MLSRDHRRARIVLVALAACSGQTAQGPEPRPEAGQAVPAPVPELAPAMPPNPDSPSAFTTPPPRRPDMAVDLPEAPVPPACDLAFTEVAAFQAVKSVLWREGEIVESPVNLVAGKATLFRAYVAPGPQWDLRMVKARLSLFVPDHDVRHYEAETWMTESSTDASGASTFNFSVEGQAMTPQTRYRVELELGSDCQGPAARVPREGPLPVGAVEVAPFELMIVPFAYGADGSFRLPDTSSAQIELIRANLSAMLPMSEIVISQHLPVPTGIVLSAETFPLLLDELRAMRAKEAPRQAVHYLGLVAPTNELEDYCKGNCTAGLGFSNLANLPELRVAVSVGFAGDVSVRALVHELGHTLGLLHAPCNAGETVDPAYPHEGGLVGVWGFDHRARSLRAPTLVADFMGYCSDHWISDYSFAKVLGRLRSFMTATAAFTAGEDRHEPHVTLYLTAQGGVRAGGRHPLGAPLPGPPLTVRFAPDQGAAEAVRVYPLPFADAGGHLFLVPARLQERPGQLFLPGVTWGPVRIPTED